MDEETCIVSDAARMDPETARGYGLPKVCPAANLPHLQPVCLQVPLSCLRLPKHARASLMQSTYIRREAL